MHVKKRLCVREMRETQKRRKEEAGQHGGSSCQEEIRSRGKRQCDRLRKLLPEREWRLRNDIRRGNETYK